MPKKPLSAPEVWLPNHVIQHPEICAFHKAHFWLTFVRTNSLQKLGLLAAKRARKGCSKRSLSEWLSTQCAYFQCVLLRPNLLQKVWLTGCKKSQERVLEKAVFGARNQAPQPHD